MKPTFATALAAVGMTATFVLAVGPTASAERPVSRYKVVVCSSYDDGALGTEIPRTWTRVAKSESHCVWASPRPKHFIQLDLAAGGLRQDRRALSADVGYVERLWEPTTWMSLDSRLWDYRLSIEDAALRFRSVGNPDVRITYTAQTDDFAERVTVFRHARHHAFRAG
jgi:hypothetical protein